MGMCMCTWVSVFLACAHVNHMKAGGICHHNPVPSPFKSREGLPYQSPIALLLFSSWESEIVCICGLLQAFFAFVKSQFMVSFLHFFPKDERRDVWWDSGLPHFQTWDSLKRRWNSLSSKAYLRVRQYLLKSQGTCSTTSSWWFHQMMSQTQAS